MGADSGREAFAGKVLMLGFGSVGQAVLPLLLRHIGIGSERVCILAASVDGAQVARRFGVGLAVRPLCARNYRAELAARLAPGDFLLNLSVGVASLALIDLCRQRGALYLDTCLEPWAGHYGDAALTLAQRSNYALREQALAWRRERGAGPTALVTQGANPGLASAFVKQALLDLAADHGFAATAPACRRDWAALAHRLGIAAIQIAERDSQSAARRKLRDEFVNTWSVTGFVAEALQPSELGWGSHERHWPADALRRAYGCGAAIYLRRPGAATRVRSWTPLEGAYHGFLVTHGEAISIADHLTLREDGAVLYRPSVHYAYHPCDDAVLSLHELAGRNWRLQRAQRVMRDEIGAGIDELGVLLLGSPKGAYWFGSRLSIERARQLAPFNNATSLQVAAGVLAGMVWALRHPDRGLVEPDEIDYRLVLDTARPYLGELVGAYGDWSPLADRSALFEETLDHGHPWQFINFLAP